MQQHRDKLILAGVAQLATEGVPLPLHELSVSTAGAATGVSEAEAIAAWTDDGDVDEANAHFREAVATRILREQPGIGDQGLSSGGLQDTMEAVSSVLDTMPELESLTPEERGEWLRRVFREGTNSNHLMADRSQLWQTYVAISASLLSQQTVSSNLEAAWRHGEDTATLRYQNLYQLFAQMFGLRLRYAYTWPQFATAVSALSEGLMIRSNVSPHVRELTRCTGPNGEPEHWTLFGVAFEGLIRQFFEPDDGALETILGHEDGPRASDA